MKFLGLFVIFSVCALFGLFKATTLKERAARLGFYQKSATLLAERVRADSRELSLILPICFEDSVKLSCGEITFDTAHLKKEDIALLNEFFGALGRLDRQAEYERISLFCGLLETARLSAEREYALSGKLYRTLGALLGIGLCIFLI